ncbi:MAG: beta-glucosidase, partial [Clostridiales bacterium]|nr:beta-glucosidase [Clostridiales bacterium]
MFRLGLFENPYIEDIEKSKAIVGCEEFVSKGMEAQRKSVVLLKNDGCLPVSGKKKVFIPKVCKKSARMPDEHEPKISERWIPVDKALVNACFEMVDTPEEADIALVFIEQPNTGSGYDSEDLKAGGNGYVPISLQYADYTAVEARETSIAGGDPLEAFTNRSYKGKTDYASNEYDAQAVSDTKKAMGDKPVITIIKMNSAGMILSEIEPYSDGLVIHHGIRHDILLEAIAGVFEPSGLLPYQMPANMETVERHCEDVPFDLECHRDSAGNIYDFAFGMNWSGVILDERQTRYG